MVEEVKEEEIDTNLYSRQIGTFGLETMGTLMKMNVLIVGCRGLGVETAKNLILAGPRSVTIYDPTTVTFNDMGSNFYIKEENVANTTRAEASVVQLRELNPYVRTNTLPEFTDDMVTNYNLICITELMWNTDRVRAINEICRQHRIGFILCETLGLCSYTFLDYGPNFTVKDKDGEATKQFIVANVEQGENPRVNVHEDTRHTYQDGDYVKFVEVEGMTELNDAGPIEIFDSRAYDFRLRLDTSNFGAYTRQGIVEDEKVPKQIAFHSFAESVLSPAASTPYGFLEPLDMNMFGMSRSEQLHQAIGGVHAFRNEEGRYPENNPEDLAKVVAKVQQMNEAMKQNENQISVEEVDEQIVRNVAAYSTCSITSMCAMFGGFIAQEIVKFTGKYMPLKQWAHYDCFESLPTEEPITREPMGCRYDDQIKIYGREVQEKLGNVKTFMIGAGALGCEYIKAMALMGLGCGPNGSVTVTDNDSIEISNLNRQFLFRQADVTHSKSATACAKAKAMNPALNVTSHQAFVAPSTEDLFNDEFWESLNFIVNAVDNVKARLYVDSQCVWYEKPLLESGTLGTKANSQMIVPHKTSAYGDSRDPPEEEIPLCTLRLYPNQIEHCIEWGRDKFNTLFCQRVQDIAEYLRGTEAFVKNLRQNSTSAGAREQLNEISQVLGLKASGLVNHVVKESREIFNTFYDHSIRDILGVFPENHVDTSGQPFWSGPKRCPTPLTFNPEDDTHINFIWACSNLIFDTLGVFKIDRATAKLIVSQIPPAEYVRKIVHVETPEEAKEREAAGRPPPEMNASSDDDEPAIAQLLQSLEGKTRDLDAESFKPADFEKDDDTNFHIDFITACSNLRARNYKITEADRNKTKMIAGKIIPAIATTTAMITGVVSNEIYKYTQGFDDVTKFKNSFCNLSLPSLMFTQPDDVKKLFSKELDIDMGGPCTRLPEGYTGYDKTVLSVGSLTIQGLFDWLRENKGVECYSLDSGEEVVLYNQYFPGNKHVPRLTRAIEDIYSEFSKTPIPSGRHYLKLNVMGNITESGADFLMPPIKYYFA